MRLVGKPCHKALSYAQMSLLKGSQQTLMLAVAGLMAKLIVSLTELISAPPMHNRATSPASSSY